MDPRDAARVHELEATRHLMHMVNRYLAAGQPKRIQELGLTRAETRRLIAAGGYSSQEMTRIREAIRYHKRKHRGRVRPQ